MLGLPRNQCWLIGGLAGAALVTASLVPPLIRSAATGAITVSVAFNTGLPTVCRPSPAHAMQTIDTWFNLIVPQDCTVDAAFIPSGPRATPCGIRNFDMLGYNATILGHNVSVVAAGAGVATARHEEAHRRQSAPPLQSVADHVVYYTFAEADARVAVIISAYQDWLMRGDRTVWDHVNRNDSAMVRVFDLMLQADPRSQALLASGQLPSPAISRAAAMAYLFSATSEHYMQNNYAVLYPNLQAELARPNALTLTPEVISAALPHGGPNYLFSPDAARKGVAQNNPLNRWVLYRTLRLPLGRNEQQEAISSGLTATDLAAADRTLQDQTRCETQAEARGANGSALHPQIEELAYRAAGLARFRHDLSTAPLDAPLGGSRRAPLLTPPAPPAALP